MTRPVPIGAAVLLAILCSPAIAADIQMGVDLGVGRSDNIARTSTDERSETIRSVGLEMAVVEQTRRMDANLAADLSWLDYASDVYSDELSGSATGRIDLSLITNRLHWIIEDRFGQVRQDLFSAPSPDNRENVNHFSTGPDLQLGLGANSRLGLGGRYTLVNYEHTQTDTRRLSAYLAASRELSSSARVSVNLSGDQIEARGSSVEADYDRSSAFLQYAVTGRRTELSLDVGGNRVKGTGLEGSGLLLRVDLSRQLGDRSRLSVRVGQEYTDSGESLGVQAGEIPVPVPGTGTVEQSSQPYTDRYVRLGWDITGRLTTIDFSANWSDQDYDDAVAPSAKRFSMGMGATRVLGQRTDIAARVRHELHDYSAPLADNDETVYGLALTWRAGRKLGFQLEAEHSDFSAGSESMNETRYWARVRYGERTSN